METKRYYTEYYLADAMRLANYFAERYGGTLSEALGDVSLFPNPPKRPFQSSDVRFIRVDCGALMFGVAFVSDQEPPEEERKYRNKSLYRVLAGDEVRKARERKGMTIQEVAEKTGFRPHAIERFEEGRYDFDLMQFGVILDAIGCKLKVE